MEFEKLKVVELRAELASRNLPTNGRKDEMIARLQEYERDQVRVSAETVAVTLRDQMRVSAETVAVTPPSPVMEQPVPEAPVAIHEQPPTVDEVAEKMRLRALRFGLPVDANQAAAAAQTPSDQALQRTIQQLSQPLSQNKRHFHTHRSFRK